MIFFCKVVPAAFKHLGLKMKGMNYGVVKDLAKQFTFSMMMNSKPISKTLEQDLTS